MGWTIQIGEGSGALTLDANIRFDFLAEARDTDSGRVQYFDRTFEIEGDVKQPTPGQVADSLIALSNGMITSYSPQRLTIKLDNVTKFDFTPALCIGSPRITRFRTIQEEGGGASHWRYSMTVYVKQPGGVGGETLDVFDFQSSILVEKQGTIIIRKVWRAMCKARTVEIAKARVKAFKPANVSPLHETIEEAKQEARASAEWEWTLTDATTPDVPEELQEAIKRGIIPRSAVPVKKDGAFVMMDENPVTKEGGGNDFIEEAQVSEDGHPVPPLLPPARGKAAILRVRGTVYGLTQKLVPPKAHFKDVPGNMVRWSQRETISDVRVRDVALGIFERPYEEVWLNADGKVEVTNADHSTHQNVLKPKTISLPDGPIASQAA